MQILGNHFFQPSTKVMVRDLALAAGKSPAEANDLIETTGFEQLRWCRVPGMSAFVEAALTNQVFTSDIDLSRVAAIVSVTQSQDVRIPNLAALVQSLLDVNREALCLDLIDGCNGFVKSLRVVDDVLQQGELAVIVSGEINSSMTFESDLGTRILFGDGLCLTVVVRGADRIRSIVRNDGVRGKFITAEFKRPILTMNGFEVFRFTNTEVPRMIADCDWVDSGDGNSIFALHQASKLVVDQIGKRLGITQQSPSLFNATRTGNIGAGSIPAWIALSGLPVATSRRVHCVGFGAGLSWGLATVDVNLQENNVYELDI